MASQAQTTSSGSSGLMMARLLLRAITHRPAKLFTVIAALAVGATLASAFLSLYYDLPAKMSSEFRSLGPNLLITPPEIQTAPQQSSGEQQPVLSEQAISVAHVSASGAEVLPWLYAVGLVNKKTLLLAGTDIDSIAAVHPSWRITQVANTGSANSPNGTDAEGVYVGEREMGRQGLTLENADQQWITLEYAGTEHHLPLRGVVSTGGSMDDQLVVPLALLQQITARPAQISAIEVAAPGSNAAIEQTQSALVGALGDAATVRPLRPVL